MPRKPTGRPRGRPPGSKNIPRIEAFVSDSLAAPPPIPAVVEKPPTRPRGLWGKMTPEERSAYARRIGAIGLRSGTRKPSRRGVPFGLSVAEYEAALATQRPVVAKIMKKMGQRGELPEDPAAVEALKTAMLVLRSPVVASDRTAAARLILDFTKSRPTARVHSDVKSAEDWVDEMAAEA